jgi:DNA replication protein DnaC
MKLQNEIKAQIIKYSKELRLPVFRNEFEQVAQDAAKEQADYETFLLRLMEREYDTRLENRKKAQIRLAGFPAKLNLHDLKRNLLPVDAAGKLTMLERLDFIASGQNIILAGNPGTGKTHIATGLGLKACLQGYRVYFTTIHGLLTQLRESHAQRSLRQMELRFEKYDLVICDEFGYISFDKEGAELLFNHLSLRSGRKSTIITTNLGFDRWEEIFGDPVLTAALVDRLTHKAHLVNMNGESYRLRETKEMMKK